MKKKFKELAVQRMYRIIEVARETARCDLKLAQKQAIIARRISMKYRVRMPYELRQLFCKRCKKFIIPGINARVRVGRTNVKAIRITCLECNHVYRKIIK
ncbi:MAG: RNase P subunit [Candidatus Nitrosothermus koennekii]|nr:MAG: RNase P subunit [Candidatus Nitrosothermus koennekii]